MLATFVIWPLAVGTNAIFCVTPFTVMSAILCVVSPLVYRMRIVVRVVADEETPLNWRVPPPLPPMYPTEVPEQSEQVTICVPAVRVLALDSAS